MSDKQTLEPVKVSPTVLKEYSKLNFLIEKLNVNVRVIIINGKLRFQSTIGNKLLTNEEAWELIGEADIDIATRQMMRNGQNIERKTLANTYLNSLREGGIKAIFKKKAEDSDENAKKNDEAVKFFTPSIEYAKKRKLIPEKDAEELIEKVSHMRYLDIRDSIRIMGEIDRDISLLEEAIEDTYDLVRKTDNQRIKQEIRDVRETLKEYLSEYVFEHPTDVCEWYLEQVKKGKLTNAEAYEIAMETAEKVIEIRSEQRKESINDAKTQRELAQGYRDLVSKIRSK